MDIEDAVEALYDFISEYFEKKKGFRKEALALGLPLDSKDKAALTLANVTPWNDARKLTILFRCASELDYESEPLVGWMNEVVAAAHKHEPEAAKAAELVIECVRERGPGLRL